MAQLILGKTTCVLCGQGIASSTDAVGFPAFIPRGHEFEQFSDCAFHRHCFSSWAERDRFQKLYDEYERVWRARPQGLSFDEIEEWGKKAFEQVFKAPTGQA